MTSDHGTHASYKGGCSCERCRRAEVGYQTARRAARADAASRGALPVPHGTTNGYNNYGCRCDPCRSATAAYMRGYRRRKRSAS